MVLGHIVTEVIERPSCCSYRLFTRVGHSHATPKVVQLIRVVQGTAVRLLQRKQLQDLVYHKATVSQFRKVVWRKNLHDQG